MTVNPLTRRLCTTRSHSNRRPAARRQPWIARLGSGRQFLLFAHVAGCARVGNDQSRTVTEDPQISRV